jgi:hypothetical protein
MKRLFYLPFILLLSITLFSGKAAAQADFMMQGWYWDYPKPGCNNYSGTSLAALMAARAADQKEAGFTMMWMPPMAKASFGDCSMGYDPQDLYDYGQYSGQTGLGTGVEVEAWITAMQANDIYPIADVVYNHRDRGDWEDNPAVRDYIMNYPWSGCSGGATPYPVNGKMRYRLPLGGSSGNGAGAYYFKFASASGDAGFHGRQYKLYFATQNTVFVNDTIFETADNGGSDCGQSNDQIWLGRNIFASQETTTGCNTDEFYLQLESADFISTGDYLDIYIEEIGGGGTGIDQRIYGIWSGPRNMDIINDLAVQTKTNFSGLPSNQGAMHWRHFKPNGITPTCLTGDLDFPYFFFDVEQGYNGDQGGESTLKVYSDWNKWMWNDVGIRGFRMDAIKHFPAWFVGYMLNELYDAGIYPPMVVGEWFGTDTEELAGWVNEVYDYMSEPAKQAIVPRIFDFSLRDALRRACDEFGYDVRNVFTTGIVDEGKLNGLNVVTFANNHDFRSSGGFESLIQNDAILAYAYILTNNQVGLPTVFYPDYYGYPEQGEPGYHNYHPDDKAPLRDQIDELMDIHNQYIFGASSRTYLNNHGSSFGNSAGDANSYLLVYQLKGDQDFKDLVVAINFGGDGVQFSQQLDGIAIGTQFEDLTGNANFTAPTVENANNISNSIWLDLPERSYAVYRIGAWGLFDASRSSISFGVNNVDEDFTVWNSGTGTINDNDFGTFTDVDELLIKDFDIKTWKSSGADVTGGSFYYTVYLKDQRPESPVFNSHAITWQEDLGNENQRWGFENATISLLDGLAAGEYTVEFYAEMNGADPNKSEFDSNNGANYKAYFRYNYARSNNDGNWNLSATWLDEVIPDNVAMSAEINHNIVLAESQSLYDLILLDGSLTLTPNVRLTVTNTLNSDLPASVLLLQSSSSHTASLIHHTANVQATVQRYVSGGWGAWDEGWHIISSPVAGQAIAGFAATGAGNDYDFYGWNETANTWMNHKADGFYSWNGSENFNPGQGYLISYEQTQNDKTFTGTLNIDNIPLTDITYTPGAGAGWHLMGNPFASALHWNDGAWALSNVAGTAKIWHAENKSYSDIAPNGIIPSAQGFMIQVNNTSNSITIPAISRVHSNDAWYKSTGNGILLIARETDGSGAQESRIRLNDQATAGYDFYYDSRFLPGYAPQFYSIADGILLSTSVLPDITEETEIEFGFIKNSEDDFIIELAENLPGLSPLLIDNKLDVVHDLAKNPVYNFTSEQGDEPGRFLLKFGPVGIHETTDYSALRAYYRDNRLMVITDEPASLALYDLTGRLLQTHHIGGAGQTAIPFDFPTGMYIVNLTSRSASTAVKVIVP